MFRSHRALIALALTLSTPCPAQEFRAIQPIPSQAEQHRAAADMARQGLQPLDRAVPIPRTVVEEALRRMAETWNGPDMQKTLAADFRDKERLGDTLTRLAPADARLRLLSLGSWRTLAQGIRSDPTGDILVSRLAVIARTQVEYTDANGSLQRRPGEQEYQITVSLKVDKK